MQHFLKRLVVGLALAAGPMAGAATAPVPSFSEQTLIGHLNEAIRWHRQVKAGRQWIAQPSEEFFWSNQLSLANQVIRSAFASARAEVPLVTPKTPAVKGAAAAPANADQERIARAQAARANRIRQLQGQIDTLNSQIPSAPTAAARATAVARRDALQAEVNLFKTMGESLQKLADLLNGPTDDNVATTLAGRVDALEVSVPEAFPETFGPAAADTAQSSSVIVQSGGLIKQTTTLFALSRCLSALDALTRGTTHLQAGVAEMQIPIRAAVGGIVQQGEKLGEQLAVAEPAQLTGTRQSLEAMSAEFKQLSVVSLALRKESMLFTQSLTNLQQWRDSVYQLYHRALWRLITRIAGILAMLAAVFTISEVWQRMTLRYVQDERRRRQFLLIRRFVTGALMISVTIIGFISDFSSLATFAGVITAGIAVALQTILLSLAAYFFMIGRSGLRSGDRVTIAGVTGDVMTVGPVRFYVKELVGVGDDLKPTGRMAIFSNSVIFQHSPIFRPMREEKKP